MTSDPVARYLAMRAAKVERRSRLRPMTSGEVLDMSLGVARNLGLQFLRVSLNPTFFCIASLEFVFMHVLPGMEFTTRPNSTTGQVGEALFSLVLALLVGGPIFLIGLGYASSVVIQITSNFILGKPTDSETAEISIRSRLGTIFLCGLRELFVCFGCVLTGIAILLLSGVVASATGDDTATAGLLAIAGTLALIVGIILVLMLVASRAIIFPVLIIEGIGIREATARAKKLIKGSRYHPGGAGTIGSLYVVSFFAFAAIAGGAAGILAIFDIEGMVRGWTNHSSLEPLLTKAVWLVPIFLAVWPLLPFWSIVLTVLYYERRIRIEGFDIEQLAEEIGRDGRTNRFNV